MAPHSDHAWHQSSHRSTLLVMRWKSLASTPLAINLGAQLSMALCTRSSLAMCLSFTNVGASNLLAAVDVCTGCYYRRDCRPRTSTVLPCYLPPPRCAHLVRLARACRGDPE